MKEYLINLREKYETKDFIKSDPIQFPHLFLKDRKNLEIIAFIASIFAFGKRECFIKKLNEILDIMNFNPFEFLLNFEKNSHKLDGLVYRFYKTNDIKALFCILSRMLNSGMLLGDMFYENRNKNVRNMLYNVYSYFETSKFNPKTQGFNFMLSNPNRGGANKRMNMFLRWMVRKGPVDFGIWDFISPGDLILPLDVHAGNVSRTLGLLKRRQNDYIAACDLTEKLKEFDEEDPVSFDFALFGAGINKENLQVFNTV